MEILEIQIVEMGGYVNFRREKNISLIKSSIIYRSSSFVSYFIYVTGNHRFRGRQNGQKSSKRNNKKNFQRVFFFSPRPNSNTLPPCRPNVFLNSCSMRKGAKERKMRVTRIEFMPPHTPPIYSRVVCSRVFTTHPFASRQKTINTPRKSIICYVNIRRGHSLYHPSRRFFFMDPPFCTKLIVTSLCSFILLVSSTLTKFYGKVVQIYNNDSSYNTKRRKRLITRIIKLKFPYISTHAAQAKWNLDFWKRNGR